MKIILIPVISIHTLKVVIGSNILEILEWMPKYKLLLYFKHGYGKLEFVNGDKYEGMFKDDMIDGKGIFIRKNGENLNGIWKNNRLIWIFIFIWFSKLQILIFSFYLII